MICNKKEEGGGIGKRVVGRGYILIGVDERREGFR